MSFDEQPDGDPHGECAFEIARLEKELSAMTKQRDHYLNMNTMLQKECAELRKRIDEADAIILQLTMDHHSSPNYVSGFERARGYFSRYPNSATMKGE